MGAQLETFQHIESRQSHTLWNLSLAFSCSIMGAQKHLKSAALSSKGDLRFQISHTI